MSLFKLFALPLLMASLLLPSQMMAKPVEEPITINVSCGSIGMEYELCRQNVTQWEAISGHRVQLISAPRDFTERLNLYQQQLSAKADNVDVLQIDVIWSGMLAEYLLDLSPHFAEEELADFFQESIANDTVGGRLVAIPWFNEVGLLYYRKDLLEQYQRPIPETWEELAATARYIQAAENRHNTGEESRLWGYVFQGRAYEGLTCNVLEWVHSHGGGSIIDVDGNITVDNQHAIAALDMARQWIYPPADTAPITPERVLNYSEEDTRGAFQAGRAVFMRNWPYAWPMLAAPGSAVYGKVGVTTLPRADTALPSTGTLGGYRLAVAEHSKHPDVAIDLVKFLTSKKVIRERALNGAYDSPRQSLYNDPAILSRQDYIPMVLKLYQGEAVLRPANVAGIHYNQVSSAIWSITHAVLKGEVSAEKGVALLEKELEGVLGE